jgi:hypothetical protein
MGLIIRTTTAVLFPMLKLTLHCHCAAADEPGYERFTRFYLFSIPGWSSRSSTYLSSKGWGSRASANFPFGIHFLHLFF